MLACAASRTTAAEETWACSIIEDGKPQVIKFTSAKSSVRMSDWRSRLLGMFGTNMDDMNTLQLVADNKDALVAVSTPRVNREMGTTVEVSIDIYAIDKYTGQLTITTASTATNAGEIKGKCAK